MEEVYNAQTKHTVGFECYGLVTLAIAALEHNTAVDRLP
jgi:hypothetical protein